MALAANRVAPLRIQLGWIHHASRGRVVYVFAAWAMAALATYSVFEKRRIAIAILGAQHRSYAARMAQQTTRLHRPAQPDIRLSLIPRRCVPKLLLGIPSDGQLKQIAVPNAKPSATGGIRPNEIVNRGSAALKTQSISADLVAMPGGLEIGVRQWLRRPAGSGHRCLSVGIGDGGVAGPAHRAPDEDCRGKHQHLIYLVTAADPDC